MEPVDYSIKKIIVVIPIIVSPFLVFNWSKMMWVLFKNRKNFEKANFVKIFPFKSVVLFIVPIFAVFILGDIMASKTRVRVIQFLTASKNSSVIINGIPSSDPAGVSKELSKVAPMFGHSFHPTKNI